MISHRLMQLIYPLLEYKLIYSLGTKDTIYFTRFREMIRRLEKMIALTRYRCRTKIGGRSSRLLSLIVFFADFVSQKYWICCKK